MVAVVFCSFSVAEQTAAHTKNYSVILAFAPMSDSAGFKVVTFFTNFKGTFAETGADGGAVGDSDFSLGSALGKGTGSAA